MEQLNKKKGGDEIKPPLLPQTFRNDRYNQIMITDKTNPFCFGGFPGPDSTKEHCYAPSTGVHWYDWPRRALRYDFNNAGTIATLWKNTSTVIIHEKEFMWIVNDLVVTEQCVCANPGVRFGEKIYPIHYDFMTTGSKYLGREKIAVEWLQPDQRAGSEGNDGLYLVDHWVKGPHHIWVDVIGGYVIRFWQPWNGLQSFDPARWFVGDEARSNADNSDPYFTPPVKCKKDGARMRIHCDDDGNNNQTPDTDLDGDFSFLAKKLKLTAKREQETKTGESEIYV